MLLGALIRELPDVFEAEVLTKLSVKDHLTLAQVNKECRGRRVQLEPLEFMRTCLDSYDEAWCKEQSVYEHKLAHSEVQGGRCHRVVLTS